MFVPSPSVKSNNTLDEETIRKKAIFFEKNVTSYQKSVNDASVNLCLKNPSLLFIKRGDLLNMAKDKVHEDGYNYKKGKSRSIKRSTTSDESVPKRSKIDTAERLRRINEIHEDIGHIDTQIEFKNRRIEAATVTKCYKTCDELSAEIAALQMQRRELVKELGILEKKAKKSAIYMKSKEKTHTELEVTITSQDIEESQSGGGESDSEQPFVEGLPHPVET